MKDSHVILDKVEMGFALSHRNKQNPLNKYKELKSVT